MERFSEFEIDGAVIYGEYSGSDFYLISMEVRGVNYIFNGELTKYYRRGIETESLKSGLKIKDEVFVAHPRALQKLMPEWIKEEPLYDYTANDFEKVIEAIKLYESGDVLALTDFKRY